MIKRLSIFVLLIFLLTGAGMIGVAQSVEGAPAQAAADAVKLEKKRTLWDTIKLGGWAMWPLGICSFGVVAFTALNFQRVNRRQMLPAGLIAQIKSAAKTDDLQQVLNLASTSDSFFARVLVAGLNKIRPDDPEGSRAKAEVAISEAAGREEANYAFWINFLSLITGMAPMWGLLGTISGMIGAFDKIGAGGMGKPELLATNIGEALITTATGLIVALPAMIAYFMFRNVLGTVIKDAEYHFEEILDSVTVPESIPEA